MTNIKLGKKIACLSLSKCLLLHFFLLIFINFLIKVFVSTCLFLFSIEIMWIIEFYFLHCINRKCKADVEVVAMSQSDRSMSKVNLQYINRGFIPKYF